MSKIILDVREKDPTIRACADEFADLKRTDEDGEGRSLDFEVHTTCGQIIRAEHKGCEDLIGSFAEGKLADQVAGAGVLIVEWNPILVACLPPERQRLAANARRHLQRMSLSCPVVITDSPDETVEFLRYLARQERPVEVFASRMRVDAERVSDGILGAFSGLNPNRRLPDGRTVGEAIWANVDVDGLIEALKMETWAEIPRLGPRSVTKMVDSLRGAVSSPSTQVRQMGEPATF